MTTPRRMCAGCRVRADQDTMLRLVWDGDVSIMVDLRRRLPGRGVYLHGECIDRALRSGAVGRGLRRVLDGAAVRRVLTAVPVG